MPVYDYKCSEHGLFNELATFEQSAQPRACPTCQSLSPRVIVLPPEVRAMREENRRAHEHNEKSRHQPSFSNRDVRAEEADKRAFAQKHGKRCGCGDHQKRTSNLMYTADGKKMFPGTRPWMISH